MNLYYYGERGLIDSLLADIISDEKNQDKILNKFLKLINNKSYDKFSIYVEPSFGQSKGFGVPDLIIKANDDLYIIEAKCGTIKDSCFIGDKFDEFWKNSSELNVQLLLRYRFFKALKGLKYNDNYVAYEDKIEYNDNSHTKKNGKCQYYRALGVSKNTKWIDDIKSVELKNIYFVALTSDTDENAIKFLKDSYKLFNKFDLDQFKENLRLLRFSEVIKCLNEPRYFNETCDKFHYYNNEKNDANI